MHPMCTCMRMHTSSRECYHARPVRWLMLDVLRVACLACIVIEHTPDGGDNYSAHNTFFVAQWVLPALLLTSGVAFMHSRSPLTHYLLRLAAVFAVGVAFNIVADTATRPGWYDDFGNTVFQMFYVVAIAALAIFAHPLRVMLRTRATAKGVPFIFGLSDRIASMLLYGGLWLVVTVVYLSGLNLNHLTTTISGTAPAGSWGAYSARIVTQLPYMLAHILGLPALVSLHFVLRKAPTAQLTWLVLLYIYMPPVAFPMQFAGVPHLGMLYLLGLLHQAVPLALWPRLKTCLQSYWLLNFVFLLLLSMPTLLGRCDLFPAVTAWERFRWLAFEAVLMVLILGHVFEASDPFGVLGPLGWWALFAYVTHVGLARTLRSPWGALVEFAFIPAFLYFPVLQLAVHSLFSSPQGEWQWPWSKPQPSEMTPSLSTAKPTHGTFGNSKALACRDAERAASPLGAAP